MPLPSPFFERTSKLCTSMLYKEWAGYYAVRTYDLIHIPEYFAFRHSAGLLDITPLFKYKVTGKEAAKFLSRIMAKDISKLKINKVAYVCWCNDFGKVVDDGTVMHIGENEFFVTAADPAYLWFSRFTRGFDVSVEDWTDKICGVALQGPTSRDILKNCSDAKLDGLKFFDVTKAKINGVDVHISRTGYTGDLGYEVWVENNYALKIWDAIMSAGKNYDILPAGLDALDMVRIEAGLILKGVDYYNANHALIEDRMSSPYELGLGFTVNLEREPFNGQAALMKELKNGSRWETVGLDISWTELEKIYNQHNLPPEVPGNAWRMSIPVYHKGNPEMQIGYATSGTWSPTLKKNIAIATLSRKRDLDSNEVLFEVMVEHKRHTVTALIDKPQFFNPERKRSNPTLEKVKV